ncbi:MAG: hypothetical protein AAFO94_17030, partial [Bacteroidota bacterium]
KMRPLQSTDGTQLVLDQALQTGETYWFSVRSKTAAGLSSERTVAIPYVSESLRTCPWDNDVKVLNGRAELVGRERTKNSLSRDQPVVINLKNVGNNTVDDIAAIYSVNQALTIDEDLQSAISSGESLTYHFANGVDLSKAGNYTIDTWLQVPNDRRNSNDTIWSVIKAVQLPNPAVQFPYSEHFDEVPVYALLEDQIGLDDLQAWDARLDQGTLEIVNTGENQYLKLDSYEEGGTAELLLTLNLEEHELEGGLFLSFDYYAELLEEGAAVWVRGSDEDPWLPALDFAKAGSWQKVKRLNLAALLTEADQQLSSSFQISIRQEGLEQAIYIDDVHIEAAEQTPMVLEYFDAERVAQHARISWEMRSLSANDYFEVQVADGIGQPFRTLERMQIQNLADVLFSYEYLDESPYKKGTRYYRIKQVDQDGMFRYSELRSVDFEDLEFVKVFPNPFQESFQIEIQTAFAGPVSIRIMDAAGRLVMYRERTLEAGI